MPSVRRIGIEDQRVVGSLRVLDDLDHLELAELDDLALALPFDGRIVERVILVGEGELEREAGDAGAEPLADLLLEVVAVDGIALLVGQVLRARLGLPDVAAPVPAVLGVDRQKAWRAR